MFWLVKIYRSARDNVPLRLAVSAMLNAAYIAFNVYFALAYRDPMPLVIALFYSFLALVRFILFKSESGSEEGSLSKEVSYTVGVLLLFAAFVMSASIYFTLRFGIKKSYSPYSVIPQAAFSSARLSGLCFVPPDTRV